MKPNFIIIGAPRAGTTSLYHYLRQHPQIVMSRVKETNYFAYLASQFETDHKIAPRSNWVVTSPAEYEALFDAKKDTKAIGEASPFYSYAPGVPQQIKTHIPDVKLILIVRNPIERAYSTYLKNRREGTETRSFEDALAQEIQNPSKVVCSENYYIRAGMYFEHIIRYRNHFDKSQLKIVFQEDLQNTPLQVLEDIFGFLGVDTAFSPDVSVRFNEAMPPLVVKKTSGRQLMKSLTRRIREYLPQKLYFSLLNIQYAVNKKVAVYPALPTSLRALLRDHYMQDVQNLQNLLERDLSHWLVVE
jgi:hypothetical protein